MVWSDDYSLTDIQKRVGHIIGSQVTNEYSEVDLDRDPQMLENYVNRESIDIVRVLNE